MLTASLTWQNKMISRCKRHQLGKPPKLISSMLFFITQTSSSTHPYMGQYLVLVLKTQLASIPITSLIVPLLGSRGTTHVLVESVT